MKTIYSILLIIVFSFTHKAQNFLLQSMTPPTCFGVCDGQAVFTTTTTTGPFTAVIINSGGCPNSTVQTSSANSITLTNLCTCVSDYTVSFFDTFNSLVGYEFLQVPITATAQLILYTPTVVPSVCSTCCNGEVYVNWSGGYAPFPNFPTITIDAVNIGTSYYPNSSVCPGTHTLCVTDLNNCTVCNTFSVGFVNHVGVSENSSDFKFSIYPNPTSDYITIDANETLGESLEIRITDIQGKLLLKQSFASALAIQRIDVSLFSKGMYYLEIQNKKNQLLRTKIIKNDP